MSRSRRSKKNPRTRPTKGEGGQSGGAGSTAKAWLRAPAPLLLGGVLFFLVVVLYFPRGGEEFLYDSRVQIATSPWIHTPSNWPSVLTLRVLGMDVLDANRPVQLASLMLDSALWGREDPAGYRITNLLLHGIVTVLILALLQSFPQNQKAERVGGNGVRQWVGFCAALLFAIHPLVTEVVCEPSNREDLLATMFCLTGLLLVVRYRPETRALWLLAVGVGACSFLAVGSKENGLVLPFAVLAYWWCFRREEPLGVWVPVLLSSFCAAGGFLAARFLFAFPDSEIFTSAPVHPGGSLGAALLLQPRILALYVVHVLFPVSLSADYGIHSLRHLGLGVSVAILLGVCGLAFFQMWKDRRAVVPWVMIFGALLPVMNFVPIYRPAADRYLYLPLAAGLLLAGFAAGNFLWKNTPVRRWVMVLVFVGFASGFLAGNLSRQEVWKTNVALWQDALQKNPRSPTAAQGYGAALRNAGRLVESESVLAHALRLSEEKDGMVWADVAILLHLQGRQEDSARALRRAIELEGRIAEPKRAIETFHMDFVTADAISRLLQKDSLTAEEN